MGRGERKVLGPGARGAVPGRLPVSVRLLVVDDELAIREWLRRALGALGYDVLDAADAGSAMRTLQSTRIDAAILDLRLMGHSGLDVLEYIRFRADLAQLPVVILTGVSHLSEAEEEVIRLHRAYVLYKPEAVDGIASLLARVTQPGAAVQP
jgi:DNA-binding response OmpR family regulator